MKFKPWRARREIKCPAPVRIAARRRRERHLVDIGNDDIAAEYIELRARWCRDRDRSGTRLGRLARDQPLLMLGISNGQFLDGGFDRPVLRAKSGTAL